MVTVILGCKELSLSAAIVILNEVKDLAPTVARCSVKGHGTPGCGIT
jgi:hypothetical protein